jgi:hypothetical protein
MHGGALAGRILFSLKFVRSGVNHLGNRRWSKQTDQIDPRWFTTG